MGISACAAKEMGTGRQRERDGRAGNISYIVILIIIAATGGYRNNLFCVNHNLRGSNGTLLIIVSSRLLVFSVPTTCRSLGRLRARGHGLDGWPGPDDAPSARRPRLPPGIRTLPSRGILRTPLVISGRGKSIRRGINV